MYPTIDELMQDAGCETWPERWREIYDGVMTEYDNNGGTRLCDPDFYRELHARYGALPIYLDVICQAAEEIGKNESLARLLALLGAALTDREHAVEDVAAFVQPALKDGKRDFAVDMLTVLAAVSMAPYSYQKMKERNIPSDIILGTLTMPEKGIKEFQKRNGGAYGYRLLNWHQRAIDAIIFRIGRLEFELCHYNSRSAVFENAKGETVALSDGERFHRDGVVLGSAGYEDETDSFTASISESEDCYIGHPHDRFGHCSTEEVRLPKTEWKKRVSYGDKVVALHIPAGETFTPEVIDEAIAGAKKFVKKYFPEWDNGVYTCASWLLYPELGELIGEESNIVKYGRRFSLISISSGGMSPMYFVYLYPRGTTPELSSLSENTRLERALKAHYMNGGYVYDVFGYFLDNEA